MTYREIFKDCKEQIIEDFNRYNTDWRFFGSTTFADLIHLEMVDFSKARNKEIQYHHMLKIINLCIKAIIQKKINPVIVPENMEEFHKNTQMKKDDLIRIFTQIWFELEEDLRESEQPIEEIEKEILKYSIYHKKNIASNTVSYFSHIYELSFNASLNLKK